MPQNNNWKISILGSGNVGKKIGSYFLAFKDITVIFYDIAKNVIKELKESGYTATLDIEYAINNSDISFIAVPTPLEKNGLYDISYLADISKKIGNIRFNKYHIFVIKSTVIPGTTEDIIIPIINKYNQKFNQIYNHQTYDPDDPYFGIIYNPEFLTVIQNTWTDDKKFCISPANEGRIILGEGENKKAGDILQKLYKKIAPDIPILRTNYKTAELTKLVGNNRLALAISFSNEIFLICEKLKENGINIDTNFIIDAISRDPRIGKYGSIFGQAWGGPCFLKDTVALDTYIKNEINFSKLISNSVEINNMMKEKFGIRE